MLRVMPVSAAHGYESLMVLGIEVHVGQVVVVLLVGAGTLNLRSHGIEGDVAGHDVGHKVFLATRLLHKPAAHLVALRGDGGGVVDGKLADGSVFLHGLCAHRRTVGVQVGQGEVGFLHEVGDVVDGDACEGHGDGDSTLGVVALVGDLAQLASGGSDVGDRIGCRDHLVFLRQFDGGHILLAVGLEDVTGRVGHAIGNE